MSKKSLFLTVCLNPVIQRTLILPDLQENRVNRSREYRIDASGKGVNVTRVLSQLGENVIHLTHAGGYFQKYFLQLCRNDGLKVQWVDSGSEIRTCTTLINRKNNTSTEIVEEAKPVKPETEAGIRRLFTGLMNKARVLIISGTKAEGYSADLYPSMVCEAKKRGMMVFLDYRGRDLLDSITYNPDIIKPNYAEFFSTFFPEIIDQQEQENKIKQKILDLASKNIITILTRGASPVLYPENGVVRQFPVKKIYPLNTIGCGDAFTAGLAAGLSSGENLDDALKKAVWCAAKNARNIRPGAIVET
ncbi:bifunctional hydroxymethylpyrimidine kinase/phosphomethylpyrimidine kinase [candidate division KSB1 bacterium]|nr:bifunctional hydroxymethylpyrimidine kinase/phosphomethylpyrimidine kinase [candidate division KSB1 bacterium]